MKVQCACINIRRAANSLTRLYDETLAPSGLLVTQFSLLRAVERGGEARLGELAREVELDRTTLTRNLRPLERQGLVEISAGEDPRARCVTLTARGRKALARAVPFWEQAQEAVRAAVGSTVLDDTLRRLDKLRAGARAIKTARSLTAKASASRHRAR